MKCKNCGSDIIFCNRICVCSSCGTQHNIESIFENNDVCICYIGTDQKGRRTKDSIIAAEIYKTLESKNITCFYEYVSASNTIGDDLETLRYTAIVKSKIIILVGTNSQNFITLYKKYASAFGDKKILPILSDMKAEQLPEAIKCFQASNFDALGALNDLSNSVLNILGRSKELEVEELYNKSQKKRKIITISLSSLLGVIICVLSILVIVFWTGNNQFNDEHIYNTAIQLVEDEKYLDAAIEFNKIKDYKDSANQFKKIYDRYDGYYQNNKKDCSLYLNIVEGKTAEFCVEKIVDNKNVKIEQTMVLENNCLRGSYIDNLSNEGEISIVLNNSFIELKVSTSHTNDEVSFGDINIQFQLKNKSDRPQIKTVTKEMLLEWVGNKTTKEEIISEGYDVIYMEDVYEITERETFCLHFKISNTDIVLITNIDDDYIIGCIAPASLVCSDRIGENACVFSKDNIIYVPNAKHMDFYHSSFSAEEKVWSFEVEGHGAAFNSLESRTMDELFITSDSMVGITSMEMIGEKNYNNTIKENQNIYYRTLVLQQYKKDNQNFSEEDTINDILFLAENNEAVLLNIHTTFSSEEWYEGSFNYYRLDLSTRKCTFIKKHDQVSYINNYGSMVYSYDEWKEYPEYFKEFMTSEEYEEATTCWSCGEKISNPRDYDGECEDCYNGIYED